MAGHYRSDLSKGMWGLQRLAAPVSYLACWSFIQWKKLEASTAWSVNHFGGFSASDPRKTGMGSTAQQSQLQGRGQGLLPWALGGGQDAESEDHSLSFRPRTMKT